VFPLGLLPPKHPFITFCGHKSSVTTRWPAHCSLEELTVMIFKHQK
jgi:hypothetical protein